MMSNKNNRNGKGRVSKNRIEEEASRRAELLANENANIMGDENLKDTLKDAYLDAFKEQVKLEKKGRHQKDT